MNRDFTLDKIFEALFKNWVKVVIITALIGLLTYLYSSYMIDFLYTSQGTLIVTAVNGQQNKDISKNQLDTSARLADTYKILLTSIKFCEKIADDVDLGYNSKSIKDMLSLSAMDNTEILSVKATTSNPEHSKKIVQSVLNNAQQEIGSVSDTYTVKVIDDAENGVRSYPNITFNTIIGLILGIILSFAFVFIGMMFNTQIKSEQDLAARYNIPLLGSVPNLNGGRKK